MRKVKDVLRLRLKLGLGQRSIARSCGMALSTVHEYLERAAAAGIGPLPEGMGDEALGGETVWVCFTLSRSQLWRRCRPSVST
jgi:hypothetical protein